MIKDLMVRCLARVAAHCGNKLVRARSLARCWLRWARTKAEGAAGRQSWYENAKGALCFSMALFAYELNLPSLAIAFGTMAMWNGARAVGWASFAIAISPRLQHPIKPLPRLLVSTRRVYRRCTSGFWMEYSGP